jgi:dipeptidase D
VTIRDLEPRSVWGHFADLSACPRVSKAEGPVLAVLKAKFDAWGLLWSQDGVGNLVVRKPASAGREGRPVVVLQAHVDMVCERAPGSTHDFARDPLTLVVDDGWVRAEGTTLGADNGVGVAAILAILEDKTLVHGPLEGLFTVDEETEMSGAAGLDAGLVTGRTVLNLDGEGPGRFCLGSAGGSFTTGRLPLTLAPADAAQGWSVVVDGLAGGHSGMEIHRQVGNAVGLLARFVATFVADQPSGLWQLASLDGGDKDNAIPRRAEAVLAGPAAGSPDAAALEAAAAAFARLVAAELGPEGAAATVTAEPRAKARHVLTPASQQALLGLVAAAPDGVLGYSKVVPGLVETSANLGSLRVADAQATLVVSQRSSAPGLLDDTIRRTAAAIRLAGGAVDQGSSYASWTPDPHSRLASVVPGLWKAFSGQDPVVEVVHAGLECGLLGQKLPGADMISFGPELKDIHTTEERVEVASVGAFYRFTLAVLEAL